MPDRYTQLLSNPSGVTVTPLAGDASGRRYARWRHPAFSSMIHMDARNDREGSVDDFVKIDTHLRAIGISAPEILAKAPHELLLEDLGDDLFAEILKSVPNLEKEIYFGATDILVEIQKSSLPEDVPELCPKTMAAAVAPAFDTYLYRATGLAQQNLKSEVSAELERVLNISYPQKPTLLLRDFHAENLLWLPKRAGVARTGVLDFQDAHIGHPSYDLASLLEDARRDVSEATRMSVIDHFISISNFDPDWFNEGFCVQAAQRNLRILGVLAHLSFNKGKHQYLAFLPRVWTQLMRDLEHPALSNLRSILTSSFPAPTQDILRRLGGPDA